MMGGHLDGLHAPALNEWLLELLSDAGLDPTGAAREAYLLVGREDLVPRSLAASP